ncbi:MAG: RNA pseudouridine synthase, partial [Eubacterium sp.]|nr:RNA pseudouridine synthase [Eubacterium sp.]
TVHQPIGRHPVERKKMAVTDKNSKDAITHYEVIKRYGDFTHICCILETGRTHQIRVHMAYTGHPLAGDPVYGPKKVITKLNGQCLHAGEIGFVHPRTNKYMEFKTQLPQYFDDFLKKLDNQSR